MHLNKEDQAPASGSAIEDLDKIKADVVQYHRIFKLPLSKQHVWVEADRRCYGCGSGAAMDT